MSKVEEIELEWGDWDGKSPFLHHCVAGSLAGVAEHTLLYPVDTVKTHMQACCSICPNNPVNTNVSKGVVRANPRVKAICTGPPASSSSTLANVEHLSSSSALAKIHPNLHLQQKHHGMWTTMRNIMNNGHVLGPMSVSAPVANRQAASLVSPTFSPTVDVATTSTSVGVARLWRGVQTMVVGCIPAHALYFSTYETCKSLLLPLSYLPHDVDKNISNETSQHHHQNLGPIGGCVAGAAATLSHDAIMTPLDTVKQRMQLGHYSGMYYAFDTIVKTEGWTGLYRSLGVTVLTNLPYGMIMVVTNEFLRDYLSRSSCKVRGMMHDSVSVGDTSDDKNSTPSRRLDLITTMLAGCGAGVSASALTAPLDRVKTRLQVQQMGITIDQATTVATAEGKGGLDRGQRGRGISITMKKKCGVTVETLCPKTAILKGASREQGYTKPSLVQYTGWRDAFDSIMREEGFVGLWRGTVPRLVVHTPAVAISWTTYEAAKRWLGKG